MGARFRRLSSTTVKSRTRQSWIWWLCATVAAVSIMTAGAIAAPTDAGVKQAWELRSNYTGRYGVAHPVGLAHDPAADRLLVADKDGRLVQMSPSQDLLGTSLLSVVNPLNLGYDPIRMRLTLLSGGRTMTAPAGALRSDAVDFTPSATPLDVVRPSGVTFDPATGIQYVLDGARRSVVVVPAGVGRGALTISLRSLPSKELKGIAYNPADGLLYVASYPDDAIYAIDSTGQLVDTYSLASVDLDDPQAMVFAPTADNTDDPNRTNLFIADAGSETMSGSVLEVSLEAPPEVVFDAAATLVRATDLSQNDPPIPDASAIAYIAHKGELLVGDSEVNEIPSLYEHVVLFPLALDGQASSTSVPGLPKEPNEAAQEPTGIAYHSVTGHLFITDDDKDRVWEVIPGADGEYGTADDPPPDKTPDFDTAAFGNTDPEDIAYNPDNGHLYVVDGTSVEVYDYEPGPDLRFGTADDPAPTHFDLWELGAVDPDGIAYYAPHGTLLVLEANGPDRVMEVSLTGTLLQTIDCTAANGVEVSALTLAPASDGSGETHIYIVARGLDPGSPPSDPPPNDGMLYELSAGLGPFGDTFTIEASAGAGGSMFPSGDVLVPDGDDRGFVITPDAGHTVSGVSVDGVALPGRPNAHIFTGVAADHTITATFESGWKAPTVIGTNVGVVNPYEALSSSYAYDTYAVFDSEEDRVVYHTWLLGVPPGADIHGIEVAVEANRSGTGRPVIIQLLKNNSLTGETRTLSADGLSATDSTLIAGGPTDLWGTTWTSTDLGDNGFRVRVATGAGDGTVNIDQVQVKAFFNAPPTITSDGGGDTAAVSVAENTTAVTTVTATDPEADPLAFAISGGSDSTYFEIDETSGELAFVSAPDFEAPGDLNADNVYEVTVGVSDGSLSDTQALSVTVTDENEAPQVADIPDQSITEGDSFQGFDLDDYVSDPDDPDSEIEWTFSGASDLTVQIDADHLVTVTYPTGWTGSEQITFTATDPDGLFGEDAAAFAVTAGGVEVPMAAGWHLVAGGPGSSTGGLSLFGFEGGAYFTATADTMQAGCGYWVKYPTAGTATLVRTSLPLTCDLVVGWNLIGNSTGSTLALPEGLTAFIWTGTAYESTPTLAAGQGAWIKATSAASIELVPVGSEQ